ncbi:hypothetical protein BLNAU_21891 [Blattamonas nauphoetae]|uniref:Uncharacterized protein n=1 Tax=Blattamonas nauphoetae TaxID=2049346 RepID=A0ABQ9WXT1_9EUKA|nr:hypothetical protein BLNAU_21891 [Blattamonas nauphoetae]
MGNTTESQFDLPLSQEDHEGSEIGPQLPEEGFTFSESDKLALFGGKYFRVSELYTQDPTDECIQKTKQITKQIGQIKPLLTTSLVYPYSDVVLPFWNQKVVEIPKFQLPYIIHNIDLFPRFYRESVLILAQRQEQIHSNIPRCLPPLREISSATADVLTVYKKTITPLIVDINTFQKQISLVEQRVKKLSLLLNSLDAGLPKELKVGGSGPISINPSTLICCFDKVDRDFAYPFSVRNNITEMVHLYFIFPKLPGIGLNVAQGFGLPGGQEQMFMLHLIPDKYMAQSDVMIVKHDKASAELKINLIPAYTAILLPPVINFSDCVIGQTYTKNFIFEPLYDFSHPFTLTTSEMADSVSFSDVEGVIPRVGSFYLTITFKPTSLQTNLGRVSVICGRDTNVDRPINNDWTNLRQNAIPSNKIISLIVLKDTEIHRRHDVSITVVKFVRTFLLHLSGFCELYGSPIWPAVDVNEHYKPVIFIYIGTDTVGFVNYAFELRIRIVPNTLIFLHSSLLHVHINQKKQRSRHIPLHSDAFHNFRHKQPLHNEILKSHFGASVRPLRPASLVLQIPLLVHWNLLLKRGFLYNLANVRKFVFFVVLVACRTLRFFV